MAGNDQKTYHLSRSGKRSVAQRSRKMQQIVHVGKEASDEQSEIFRYTANKAAETLILAWSYKQDLEPSGLQPEYETLWLELMEDYRERMIQIPHEAGLKILDVFTEMVVEEDNGNLVEQILAFFGLSSES